MEEESRRRMNKTIEEKTWGIFSWSVLEKEQWYWLGGAGGM